MILSHGHILVRAEYRLEIKQKLSESAKIVRDFTKYKVLAVYHDSPITTLAQSA